MVVNKTLKRIIFNIVIPSVITVLILFGFIKPPSEENIIYGEAYYKNFADNAAYWFDLLGWGNETVYANVTTGREMLDHSYYIYEIGHGGYYSVKLKDGYIISYRDIPHSRLPYNFIFMCSCNAMTKTYNYTWYDEFNKTGFHILLGYVNMDKDISAWSCAYRWQNDFFSCLVDGYNFSYSFNHANSKYPAMSDNIVIYGDTYLTAYNLTIPRYDLNNDARVNVLDMIIMSKHWTG